jgi:hypothetical protein
MALLGEPMEKPGSKAKGLCAIVIEDEDFKSIDASVLQANPLSGTPSATWSAITRETLSSAQLFNRTSDLTSSSGRHLRLCVLTGTSYKAGEFPSVREGVNLVDMNRAVGWMQSNDAGHSGHCRRLPAALSVFGTAGRPPLSLVPLLLVLRVFYVRAYRRHPQIFEGER